jgi:PadR family transcriptional regulator AphA
VSLEPLLLGLLRDPATGYDLRRAFEEGPAHFWSARLSQIYPALRAMERRGWLACRAEPPARGPSRRVYRRTAAGTRALRRWLLGPPRLEMERLAWAGQLAFLAELDAPGRTLRFLRALRAEFEASRRRFAAGVRELGRAQRGAPSRWDPDAFHELLCLRVAEGSLEGRIAGCDAAAALVRARLRAGRTARGRR